MYLSVKLGYNYQSNILFILLQIYYQEAQHKSNVQFKILDRKNFPEALLNGTSYIVNLDSLTLDTKYYIWVCTPVLAFIFSSLYFDIVRGTRLACAMSEEIAM